MSYITIMFKKKQQQQKRVCPTDLVQWKMILTYRPTVSGSDSYDTFGSLCEKFSSFLYY